MEWFRILITKELGPEVAKTFRDLQIDLRMESFIEIQPEIGGRQRILAKAARPITAIFTSSHAVEMVDAVLSPQQNVREWNLYCLDGQTHEAVLTAMHMRGIIIGSAPNASKLADLVADNGHEVVFFCGDKRLDTIPNALQQRNIPVNEIVVYRTELTPKRVLDRYHMIAFYSPSALDSFLKVNDMDPDVLLIASGETTARAIRSKTNNKCIVAARPSAIPETILNTVRTLREAPKPNF